MYGGGKLFTYGFNTSELGETASYAWGIWLHNFDKKNHHDNKI